MKKALTLSLLSFSFSLSAIAASQPWLAMTGKYSLPENCEIDFSSGFNKAQIKIVNGGKELEIEVYKESHVNQLYVPIAKFERPAMGTDGTEYLSVGQITENSFVSTEHFVRTGSDTWPDMTILKAYSLSIENGELTLKTRYQVNKEKAKITTCVLKSLEGDSTEVTAEKIENFTDKDFQKLAQGIDTATSANMDFDQGGIQFEKFVLNTTTPSLNQLKEALVLEANLGGTKIDIRSVKASTPQATAKAALATALGIAKKTAEYAPLRKLVGDLETLLGKNKANLKVYLVKWGHSDADGEAVLLLDQDTGEVLYLGSGYFS